MNPQVYGLAVPESKYGKYRRLVVRNSRESPPITRKHQKVKRRCGLELLREDYFGLALLRANRAQALYSTRANTSTGIPSPVRATDRLSGMIRVTFPARVTSNSICSPGFGHVDV